MENDSAVNIAVRVRPLLPHEDLDVIKYIHGEGEPPVLMVSDKRNIYAFDHIFSNNVHQCEVYNVMLKPLVSRVLAGYNCTILAYGQTGTGKTYTMGSDSQKYFDIDMGLIPRVLDEFFEVSSTDPEMSVSISFIEIYNEKVYDLLRPSKTALTVKGFTVSGMTCVQVERSEDARHWLLVGGKGRHVRHTALNASSSRSHAVFTVYCTKNDTEVTSKLHLVDLAGSESVRRTGNQGRAFQEGVTINRGLLAVGRVISALSDKHSSVIPYRDSMLTTILHDSLNADNYVSLLACVSPSDSDVAETLATLRFAVKAKALRSRPQLESIVQEFDKGHPGLLPIGPEPLTTVKKRRRPVLFTSTLVKKPRGPIVTDSPTYTTMDSLSVSTSTMIDAHDPPYNLSPLVRRCTEALQSSVMEHVNNVLQNHLNATSALQTKDNNKENSPPVVVHWPSVEQRLTQIVRNELAQMTANNTIINQSQKVISPFSKRQLDFNTSSPLASRMDNSGNIMESSLSKADNTVFKIPIGRPIKKVKDADKENVGTSPVFLKPEAPRRSTRLSMRVSVANAPTPAPRFKVPNAEFTKPKNRFTECAVASPIFKPTRRSVRLSMKCITPVAAALTPVPRDINEDNQSGDTMMKPVPAPRHSIMKPKLSPKLSAGERWRTPKNVKQSPRKRHREKVLRLLNFGSQKDLQTLPTIGVKTALQVVTFRSLNGLFKTFEDLKKIPSWRDKRYERFMQANLLI